MKVSVIVVTYNSAGTISRCLESILEQGDVISEVVVLDNGSRDRTREIVKGFSSVELIESNENLGFSRANNLVLRHLDSKNHVLLVNPDVMLSKGVVSRLLEKMQEDQSLGIVAPRLNNADGSLQFSARSFPSLFTQTCESLFLDRLFPRSKLFGKYFMRWWDHSSSRDVDWVSGALMLVRRELIDRIGLFDERFFMFDEDADLCLRARRAGYKVLYYPEVTAIHLDAQSFCFTREYKRLKWVRDSRVKFFLKHKPRILQVPLWLVLTTGYFLRMVAFALLLLFAGDRGNRLSFGSYLKLFLSQFGFELSSGEAEAPDEKPGGNGQE